MYVCIYHMRMYIFSLQLSLLVFYKIINTFFFTHREGCEDYSYNCEK